MGIKLNINGETSDKIAERRTSGDYDLMFSKLGDYCTIHKVLLQHLKRKWL